MRILEKIALIIYSDIMLILSVIVALLIFGWLDFGVVGGLAKALLVGVTSSKIILAMCVVFILLSIKCIFFDSTSKKDIKDRQGVYLENDNGKLMISKETIENLVNAVAKDFDSAQEIHTSVELDKENNLSVYVNLVVSRNVVVKELTANLQAKIKESIKKTLDLDVKQVNIKVKNIEAKKSE